jgi:hypothetical protein
MKVLSITGRIARRLSIMGVAGSLALAAMGGVAHAEHANPPGSVRGSLWQGTISGTTSTGSFTQSVNLSLFNTFALEGSNRNPFDVCVSTFGEWAMIAPARGKLRFGTNEACWGSRAMIDVVNASYNATTRTYSATFAPTWETITANVWTTASGITACPYKPFNATVSYTWSADFRRVTGTLNMSSRSQIGCGSSTYRATLTANYAGDFVF